MAPTPPPTHPPLLNLTVQAWPLEPIRKAYNHLQTDQQYRFDLPTEPDPAWTVRIFTGGCAVVVLLVLQFLFRAVDRDSPWALEFIEMVVKRSNHMTMGFLLLLSPLIISVGAFLIAFFWPGCIYSLKAALDYVLPSTWERGTAFVLIEAPSTALWYLQIGLCQLQTMLMIGLLLLGVAIQLSIPVAELALLAYPVLIITTAWTLVYLELLDSAYPHLFGKLRTGRRLRFLHSRLTAYNCALDRRTATRQTLRSLIRQPGLLSSPPFVNLGHAYCSLTSSLSTYDYRRSAQYCRWKGKLIYKVSYISHVGPSLAGMFDAHFFRRRQGILDRSSFVCSAGELAGLFANYLLPLPSLPHLRRRFHLPTFSATFTPSAALRFLLKQYQEFFADTILAWGNIMKRFVPLTTALDTFRSSFAYIEVESPQEAVLAYLSALEAEDEAIQAEEVAFEAILEALFCWKAVKEENKKQLKQD